MPQCTAGISSARLAFAEVGEADGDNQEGFEAFAKGDDKRLQHMIRFGECPAIRSKVRLGLVLKSLLTHVRPVKSDFGDCASGVVVRKLCAAMDVKYSRSLAAVLLALRRLFAPLPSRPTFRTGTRMVAALRDRHRRPETPRAGPGTKTDFEIFDNDKPQEIQLFVNEVQPITVVVMLDTSASMTGNLKLLEKAAEQFLIRMLPKDKGLVGAFNDKIEFFPSTFTSDRDRLDSIAARSGLRQPDASLRRHRRQHRPAGRDRRPPCRARLHRRRRHGQPCRRSTRARTRRATKK